MKKITIFLLAVILVLGQTTFVSFAESEEVSVDMDYENAKETLYALGLLKPGGDKAPNATVTREEFADLIAYFYNTDYELAVSTMSPTDGDKFTGYTNDVVEDEWLWEADNPADDTETDGEVQEAIAGTAYYDVSADSEYYDGIKFVSELGMMVGYNGCFRPGERITGNEMIKVMVKMMDAEFLTDKNYPFGYLQTAVQLEIITGAASNDFGAFISYKDMVMCFYNMIKAENYVFIGASYDDPENSAFYIKNGKTFLENVFKIIPAEGVVTSNSMTTLAEDASFGECTLSIDNVIFSVEDDKYDKYLGYCVDVYYTENGSMRNIKHIAKSNINKELVIQAEDIIDYNRPTLRYWDGNEKTKEVYIGADTLNVINGELAKSYTAEDIFPKEGTITLVSNNSDNQYDIVLIENYNVVWVSYVDPINQIIYDKLNKQKSYNLADREVKITDINGDELTLDRITPTCVLTIAEAENHFDITVSYDSFEGKVTSKDIDDKEITVGEKVYKLSEFATLAEPENGDSYIFYLDANEKIVAWEIADEDYLYGYLIGKASNGVIDMTHSFRLYVIDKDEFEVYELAEKVNFNDNRTEAEKVAASNLIIDASGNLITQVVMYKLDSENKIAELYTADAVDDKFVTVYENPGNATIRCNGEQYYNDQLVFYASVDSKYINVPENDVGNEDAYFERTKITGGEITSVSHAYGRNKDSLRCDLLLRMADEEATNNVSSGEGIIGIVKEVAQEYKDGENYLGITCASNSASDYTFLTKEDSKPYEILKDCKKGDIIRVVYDKNTSLVSQAEYIFRVDTKLFDKNSYLFGRYDHTNPIATGQWQIWGSQKLLLHGVVQKRYDDNVIGIAPYVYVTNGDGSISTTGIDINTQYRCLLSYSWMDPYVYLYDSQRNEVTAESLAAINDAETAGTGAEVVIYSSYSAVQAVFIYK